MKLNRIGMIACAAVAMMAFSTVWGATQTPPPPQLVANILDPLGKAAGKAGYGQQTDASGKIKASFLSVQAGPLNKALVGKKVNVSIDNGPAIPVDVVLDKSGNNGAANLNLNSANGDKVPLVKDGSMVKVSTPGNPPIAQGKFAPAK
ncbi:MAG: hypothetical protein WCJ09_14940 [Planctomycetota bacterium]